MIVRLPREVRGEELLDVIIGAAKDMEEDGLHVGYLAKNNQYEPGSVREVLHKCLVTIMQHRRNYSDNRIIRFFQRLNGGPMRAFSFPEIITDRNYREINIQIRSTDYYSYEQSPRSNEDRAVFEKLIQAIYKRLDAKLSAT